jgi:uncharacterized protein
MNELITCAASLTIGLSLGLIGAGGSILTIPVFVYILKIDPLASGIYSMFVVGICSMVGTIKSISNKLVDFTIAVQFGIPSVLGVFIARRLIYPAIPLQLFSLSGIMVTKKLLFMLCIAILMFTAAMRMLTVSGKDQDIGLQKEQKRGLLFIRGFLVGGLTGLLGIGGGFLIVPALYLWTKLTMKMVIGTTLLIITINSLFSFLTSYSAASIDWGLLLKFSAGASLGILIGIRVAEKITGDYLKKIFGWFVLSISFFIVYKQFFI